MTQFAKTWHYDAFLGIGEFYIPKALFCTNINGVLQILFKLQG